MEFVQSLTRQILRRIGRSNPERLWVHYSTALIIIFGLLLATHLVNKSIITRSSAAADVIKVSNGQVLEAQNILLIAESAMLANETEFLVLSKAIKGFEATHLDMLSSRFWSDDMQSHYFAGRQPLHHMVNEFILLANQIKDAEQEQRWQILTRLTVSFDEGGLKSSLTTSANLFEKEANAEVQSLTQLQRSLLLASAFVLLVEVVFIFVPAQLMVKSNIRQLRTQGNVLRESRTELQTANGKLEYLINHDSLTNLPNRSCLMAYLNNAIFENTSSEMGVLFIGLDGFKSINDQAGHDYGDKVLIAAAQLLQACVDEHHIVARVGGDEFVLVTDEPAKTLVERVWASFAEPIEIGGKRIPIVMSIGYLELTDDHRDPFAILADGGLALQCAKNDGGNRAQPFETTLRDAIGSQQQLQLELSDAIKNGEIEPWFQPQIRLADGMLQGAEVLARWRHPTHGLLTPDKFLPAAERAGLTIDMDHSIWRAAMGFAHDWQLDDVWNPSISLNAAPDTIADPHLIERFLLELQRSGLDANQVIIEVLETTLIDGADDMAAINIDSLAECGIALELDDFGTGYASLSKLTQLPLSGIKLDRSLIAPLPDQNADSVVRAILALAAELGLHVVAEGVEEMVQADHLQDRGCAIAQGYGYARPMPAQEFRNWLVKNANRSLRVGGDPPPQALRA